MAKNIAGQRFGRLVAIECVGSKKNRRIWRCKCDCGKEVVVAASSLIGGTTKSCGCLCQEMRVFCNTRHGDCGTRLYRIWKGVLARCRNQSSTDYKWYGAKGVRVCYEWSDYICFRDWAHANGYQENLTIDRIDPRKDYEPRNCRWATTKEQNKNRRSDWENAERTR